MAFLRQFRATPNLLTLLRLFIIPYLVIEILEGRYKAAFGLFLLAGFSDGMDGLLARMLQQRTKLGLYLDPIADKLLLSTLFLVLTHVGLIPQYVTILVFSRDLGILIIATLLFATGALRDFSPSLIGKVNTFVQILGLTLILAERAVDTGPGSWPQTEKLEALVLKTIALLAPLSAAQYAWLVIRRVSESSPQPQDAA